ncbi:hypothetical protein [Leeuwenhoekiella sp. NPDC079379]|uniref:hypothetical protein n=1 Tax=Leeuwenhoekiella sp. NPDC079379 TaxID=3364122 RepID=UPI0037C86A32
MILFRKYFKLEIITVILLIVNLAVTHFLELDSFRLVRLFSLSILIGFYLYRRHVKSVWLIYAFLFFLIRDVAYQFFEVFWGAETYMTFATLGYFFLVLDRLPFFRGSKFSLFALVIGMLLVAANGAILFELGIIVSGHVDNNLELILFYLYGVSLITLILTAYYYNHRLNSMRSLLFLMMVFCFVASDIASCLAYYVDLQILYYLDRTMFIVSMALMVNFGLNIKGAATEEVDFISLQE